MFELDTGTEDLLARLEDGVAVVTLNRPERRNAMSQAMVDALERTLDRLEIDEDVGCVVLTGAGGAFCAGGDIRGMLGHEDGEGWLYGRAMAYDARIHHQRRSQQNTSGRLWGMPKPTIAAISGAAAGAGLALALACDLRYAVDGAVLTTAFGRVGYTGDYGGGWFLTRLVGTGRARELFYFSDRVDAVDAARLGIVNEVFASETFEQQIMERARRLANGPRLAYRYMKENLNRAIHADLHEYLDVEVVHQFHAGTSEDHHEAAEAFVERREPRFRGR